MIERRTFLVAVAGLSAAALPQGASAPAIAMVRDGEDRLREHHTIRSHDNFLDQFVGRWTATGRVHGAASTQQLEAAWVLDHQFLRIHEKSVENVAGTERPFEAFYFVGYDIEAGRYVAHLLTVFGARDSETLGYGTRSGQELRLTFSGPVGDVVTRFVANAGGRSWRISSAVGTNPIIDLEVVRSSER